MQKEQQNERSSQRKPDAYRVRVPSEHWKDLQERDIGTLCNNSLARPHALNGIVLPILLEDVLVDLTSCCLRWVGSDTSQTIDCPLLELMTLVYLLNVSPDPLSQDMISVSELKDAHFFQGPHALRIGPVVKKYGYDVKGFQTAAEKLGGARMDMADTSYRFVPFPKIPLYYLLWEGDEEFGPNLSVLFDRSIERHLSADGIFGIVNLVSDLLASSMSPREL